MNSMQLSIIRHFLAPFVRRAKRNNAERSFIVRDANNQELAFVYCEDEPGRRSAASAPFFSGAAAREQGVKPFVVIAVPRGCVRQRWRCSSAAQTGSLSR